MIGPNIITEGLVLSIDGANSKSYNETTSWSDISKNSNNASLTNGPGFSNDNNGVIVFDGVNDYALISNNSTVQITGDQTLEFWVYPQRRDRRQNFYNKAYGGEGTITYEVNGSLSYYWGTNGGNGSPYQGFGTSGSPLSDINKWYHVVLVRDLSSTSRTIKWYINGTLNNSGSASYTSATAGNSPILLGDGYTNNFLGKIGLVNIYNIALKEDEVLKNYNSIKYRYE